MFKTIFALLFIIFSGCREPVSQINNDILIGDEVIEIPVAYYNGFNTTADTIGFSGYGYWNLVSDTVNQDIRNCLFVSGGCIVPHVVYNLPELGAGTFSLQIYGRKIQQGGSVSLRASSGNEISIHMIDSVWTLYDSDYTLSGDENERYHLWFNSGGIVEASMLIDNLSIIVL